MNNPESGTLPDVPGALLHRALAFDLETTGLDTNYAQPVSYALIALADGKVEDHTYRIVCPTVPVERGAAAVHGLDEAMLRQEGDDLRSSVEQIAFRLCQASSQGVPVIGMNVSFDLQIVDSLTTSLLGTSLLDLGWQGPILDALVIDRGFDTYRKGKRTLDALCEHYRVKRSGAHNALADAYDTYKVTEAVLSRFGLGVSEGEVLMGLSERQARFAGAAASSLRDYQLRTRGASDVFIAEWWPIKGSFRTAAV
jgi:DNA polymerase-3 subunit epsilon